MLRNALPGRRLSQVVLLLGAIGLLLLLILIGSRIRSFVHIFGAHAGIAITQEEVEIAHNSTTPDPRAQVVPKIIHQIFHNWKQPGNETLPADWEERRQSCVKLHPKWEYRVCREFRHP
jgi:inositol phosphorylceramide mannosyltransferase catalytic subunit